MYDSSPSISSSLDNSRGSASPNPSIAEVGEAVGERELLEFFNVRVSKATKSSRKPWLVRGIIDARSVTNAKHLELFNSSEAIAKRLSLYPLPRLWKPDSLIEFHIAALVKSLSQQRSCVVCDLGSGAGRDISFLAEESKFRAAGGGVGIIEGGEQQQQLQRKVRFHAVDYHKGCPKRCIPLWENRGVADCINLHSLDLRSVDGAREWFDKLQSKFNNNHKSNTAAAADDDAEEVSSSSPSSPSSSSSSLVLVYCVRYKNNALTQMIAASDSCVSIFATSHFVQEEDGSFPFDHPKMSEVYEINELETIFTTAAAEDGEGTNRWQILLSEIIRDSDHGRPLIQFIARRKTPKSI
jgi:hypothetical protein